MKNIILLLLPILSFGQVGVNITNPEKELDVNGTLRISKTSKNEYIANSKPLGYDANTKELVKYNNPFFKNIIAISLRPESTQLFANALYQYNTSSSSYDESITTSGINKTQIRFFVKNGTANDSNPNISFSNKIWGNSYNAYHIFFKNLNTTNPKNDTYSRKGNFNISSNQAVAYHEVDEIESNFNRPSFVDQIFISTGSSLTNEESSRKLPVNPNYILLGTHMTGGYNDNVAANIIKYDSVKGEIILNKVRLDHRFNGFNQNHQMNFLMIY